MPLEKSVNLGKESEKSKPIDNRPQGRCQVGLAMRARRVSLRGRQTLASHIGSESEVWIAEDPDRMIHFDAERFLGRYPGVMPNK